ncbi:ABC transporter substrate-binding protein [Petrocella atlantisensis]|uniref:ABC transporter substrate-binding protein n=1 Tax=Petrocella atlantisensis TaxID=2173034 RepID=A0A3P7S0W8_9FIRM|nr:ABC transporter substrate-binding protein [Petrocella atlantisensis]VDN46559.1 ABC transporter substrate-binding protein [Petrocella atlantisensis]
MISKISRSIFIMIALMLLLAACAQEDVSIEENKTAPISNEGALEQYPMTIMDKYGDSVVIEAAPDTLMSLSPEITEIIFALNAGDLMIGRSTYCDYPIETEEIQDFGTLFDLNIESIVEANPDVLFLSSMASEELASNLKNQGITVVILDKDSTLEGTYEYFQIVGQIINRSDEAKVLEEKVGEQIEAVKVAVDGLTPPTVYYVVHAAEGVDTTATGETFIHDMITLAGGDNVAKDGSDWMYSLEKIVEKNPYIMLCSKYWDTKASIVTLEGYKDLEAIKEDRLYEVDENMIVRQGPRIGEAIEVMARIFHPEAF